MEKKATRRIIGVLVAVALVIILLPLMFNGSDNQSALQASEIKAPPFPGTDTQTAQAQAANINNVNNSVASERPGSAVNNFADSNNSSVVAQQTLEPVAQAQPEDGMNMADGMKLKTAELNGQGGINAPIAKASNLVDGDAENIVVIDSENDGQQPQTITKNEVLADLNKSNAAAGTPAPAVEQPGKPVPAAPAIAANTNVTTPVQAIKKPVITPHVAAAKKPAPLAAKKVAMKKAPKVVASTETVNLKKPAWMVQLGSFKNKLNAERLTNTLRAKGYKAFTLQGKGSSVTRVCVGPEFQQTKAATLASKIAQDTNLRGIVMSYKPLEL